MTTEDELHARIAQLESENTTLRAASATDARGTGNAPESPVPSRKRGLERSRWWTALATVLIVLGALLAPLGLISSWARQELADTDTFVATFSPLAKDPQVQTFVTTEATTAIDNQLHVKQLTANVFDGIASLGLGPNVKAALKALEGPAADGITNLIHSGVQKFVSSPQFATLWTQLLRTSHNQMIKTMQGSPSAAVTIAHDGTIGVQLGPIIRAVKQQLVHQGLSFAAKIPIVDKTIVVAKSNTATLAQVGYALAIGLGTWLPWVSLIFLVAGVAVARRRTLALVWAGIALTVSMIVTQAGLGIGRIVVIRLLSSQMPRDTAQVIYNQIVAFIADTLVAIGVLAFAVAVIAWFAGPFAPAVRLRRAAGAGLDAVKRAGDRNHVSTGAVGRWLGRQTVLIRVVIALGSAAAIVFSRPISLPLIIWTAVIALLLVLVLELLRRDPAQADSPPPVPVSHA